MVLLQIKFNLSKEFYRNNDLLDKGMVEGMFPKEDAEAMAKLPGLKWKLWTIQPEDGSASGFYLFSTKSDAENRAAFANKHFVKVPGLTNVIIEVYDVMEDLSRLTRAPIDAPANPSINQ